MYSQLSCSGNNPIHLDLLIGLGYRVIWMFIPSIVSACLNLTKHEGIPRFFLYFLDGGFQTDDNENEFHYLHVRCSAAHVGGEAR